MFLWFFFKFERMMKELKINHFSFCKVRNVVVMKILTFNNNNLIHIIH